MQRWRVHHFLLLVFGTIFLSKMSELSPSAMIDQLDRILWLGLRHGFCALVLLHSWHALHALQPLLERIAKDAARTRTPKILIIGLYAVTAASMVTVVLFKL